MTSLKSVLSVSAVSYTYDESGIELCLLLIELFSPVDLLLFLLLDLSRVVCPCMSLILFLLCDVDILHTVHNGHSYVLIHNFSKTKS